MEIVIPTYAVWKALTITALGLSLRCHDVGSAKQLMALDANSITWVTTVGTDGSDQNYSDYLTNIAPLCNKQKGAPIAPFAVPNFDFAGGGMTFTADAASVTPGYFKVDVATTTGLYIVGGNLYTQGMKMGDTVSLAIVDRDGVYAPAGTILKSYVTGWNVSPTGDQGINTPYGIFIPGGLYIMVAYTNTNALTPVSVGINFLLHKPK